MQIALTKKLADATGQALAPLQEDINPLFSWTANWVKVWSNSRVEDMIVMVNNSTRFVVAIYQVKRKDLKKIDSIIKTAIANTLLSMNVNPEVVEGYLTQSGDIVFVKNSDRKATSWVNRAAEECSLEIYKGYDGIDKIYRDTIGINANYAPVNYSTSAKEGFFPYEKMFSELSSLTGKPTYKYRAYELLVTLDLDIYQAERRIIVPAEINFTALHKVLQSVFNWENSHLHEFSFYKKMPEKHEFVRPDLTLVGFEESLDYDRQVILIEDQKLSDYLLDYKQLIYTYDLGDDWQHQIQLVREIEDCSQQAPYLLEASGQTPPEDVGGVGGYIEFYKIMLNSQHPEYANLSRWAQFWTTELREWETRPKFIQS